MKMHFHKFQGNGNDFVLLDNRSGNLNLSTTQVQIICNRRFGIGADGLILLNHSSEYDFKMVYFNSDGNIGSMCGNGGRCIAAYANLLGVVGKEMVFDAWDGAHKAIITKDVVEGEEWEVKLQLADVNKIEENDEYYFLDTGSPHYVEFVDTVDEIDVPNEGRKTRNSERFAPGGTNVNFVEIGDNKINVRTYERGVEAETLSCGTGVTAAAIAVSLKTGSKEVVLHTLGGDFSVSFTQNQHGFTNIWLQGPASLVFEGEVIINKFLTDEKSG